MQQTPHPSVSEPVVFEQQNSKNHMTYTLTDEGVVVEGGWADEHSRTQLLFSEIGLLTDDRVEYTRSERNRSAMASIYAAAAIFAVSLMLLGTRQAMTNRSAADLIMYIMFAFLAVAGLLIVKFNKDINVRLRRISFSQAYYCDFYYRNPSEKERVDAFISQIDQRCVALHKKLFLEELKRDPQGLEPFLHVLHEKGAIDDTDFGRYHEIIDAANKKAQPITPADTL